MKPEEAIAILDQTVAQINASRQLHVQLQQAIECLRDVVSRPDVEEQPVKRVESVVSEEQKIECQDS